MSIKLKTLFICFYFPPFNRVGGRRWAKHIKYFYKFGEIFRVIAGDYSTRSPWDSDIKTYSSLINRIPISVYYPYYKKTLPKSVLLKIWWKISLVYNKFLMTNYKGNFWDDSRGYEKIFLEQAKKTIIKENINHICLTVGPYSYATILPVLKQKFPNIKITIDFRDYWEDNFFEMKEDNVLFEKEKIKKIMKSVDLILAPNEEMCNYYENNYNKVTYCLPHCVDEEYLNITPVKVKSVNRKELTLVYGGNLYAKIDRYILQLIEIIKSLENNGYTVTLKIFTMQPNYISLLKKNNINFELSPNLPTIEFINIAMESDMLVLFRPDWSPNGFSTKFFEYVAIKKPIVYFGPSGEVSKFISNNDLGFTTENIDAKSITEKLIDNLESKKIPNLNFNINEQTFEFQTKKLIQFWNNYYVFSS